MRALSHSELNSIYCAFGAPFDEDATLTRQQALDHSAAFNGRDAVRQVEWEERTAGEAVMDFADMLVEPEAGLTPAEQARCAEVFASAYEAELRRLADGGAP